MNNPTLTIGQHKIYLGNNLDILPTLAENSIDSIVTDPPYELGFMNKSWDSTGIAYNVQLWRECLRVLKPGGHLLAFGGSRTWHRLAVAIEDAGFEMRDSIAWLYGSGFPKSHNISKAIDKLHGAEREKEKVKGKVFTGSNNNMQGTSGEYQIADKQSITDDAKKWDGWGTALKPAFEPIVVARKPLIGTVAENVLQFGTGGLNIDASRIGYQNESDKQSAMPGSTPATEIASGNIPVLSGIRQPHDPSVGRWPANIILDETTAQLLDEQSGQVKGGTWNNTAGARHFNNDGEPTNHVSKGSDNSVGGASRFFYVAKANKKDRNEGLDGLEERQTSGGGGGIGNYLDDVNSASGKFGSEKAPAKNFHPTVKPTSLMTYLIKLVTPPNGIVLDPFTGSGSTGKAAALLGFEFIGVEITAEYLPIIEGRVQHAHDCYLNKVDDLFE